MVSGPIWVSGLNGSPTLMRDTAPRNMSRNSCLRRSGTRMRVSEKQTWPVIGME